MDLFSKNIETARNVWFGKRVNHARFEDIIFGNVI